MYAFKAVYAQSQEIKVPTNAHIQSFGNGWVCNRGYKRNNDRCTAIKLPLNAYLTARGDAWECHRGYKESQ